MKKSFFYLALFFCYGSAIFCQTLTWPKQETNLGNVLTLYQPQVENWDQFKTLDFRMAFSLVPSQQKEVIGVLDMRATTYVNTAEHQVHIYDLKITGLHFPGLDTPAAHDMGQMVRAFLPPYESVTMSLDQLVATTQKRRPTKTTEVNNDPPVIFVSYSPAILLQLEGDPAYTPTGEDKIDFVFNANWTLFYDKNKSKYYLFDDHEWQSGEHLNDLKFTSEVPKELEKLAKKDDWKNMLKAAIPAPKTPAVGMPKVFFNEKPAEIILFNGTASFAAISGTGLRYATNTSSDVFYKPSTNMYYYLVSGRWFSAPDLKGPWAFATDKLPADFASIPPNSPAAHILSSVPGTEQAADAVLLAQIPTRVQVNSNAASQVQITYSGPPKFVGIEGTNPTLYYIQNTNEKVIQINNNEYYACVQGIWFTSGTPNGPWQVANSVPAVIYTIPSSSPVYNVTFVTQTVDADGTVDASYTAGYLGAFAVGFTAGVIVASGTGFYAPPYFYYPPVGFPVCYASAYTYGAYAYHPYYGGAVAYGASYNPYTGTYARSATAYGPYGSATARQSYNPYTGTATRSGSVSTPYGTRSAGQAYNPYTGGSATTHQGSNAYGQAGTTTYNNGHGESATSAHETSNGKTVAGAQTSAGGKAVAGAGPNGSGSVAKTANGDMYATKDGNVYKGDGNGSYQKYNGNGSWSSPTSTSSEHSQELSQASQDRSRGASQSSSFGGSRFGGGGWSGGGGGWGGRSGGSFGGGGGGFRGRR